MESRITAIGVVLVAVGVFLVFAPIASEPPETTQIVPGTWVDIDVPRMDSIAGTAIEIDVTWGTPCIWIGEGGFAWCATPPIRHSPNKAYLLVLDCGAPACDSTGNYSPVGVSDAAGYGTTQFAALPGHHYQVWAFREHFPSQDWNTTVPFSYKIVEPPFGGLLGVGSILLGALAILHSIRPLTLHRDRTPNRNHARSPSR